MWDILYFYRIQFLIWLQLRPVPGGEKHGTWGTRPLGQRWKGSVQARGNCQSLHCSGSEELPSELTSITPKPPLDGWAWVSATLPLDNLVYRPGLVPTFPLTSFSGPEP
jgi:hypothetical protein